MNRLTVATILAAASIAFAAPAFADHHEEEDGCDHGATSKPCRPDPQPTNGKDCDVHGNHGGVNEDHCAPAPTTTPTEVPSSTTTTTQPTSTPSTDTPTTQTSQPPSPSPASSTPTTAPSTPSSPSVTQPRETSSTPTSPSSLPSTITTASSTVSPPSPRRNGPSSTVAPPELAHTGFTATLALLGAGLLAAGVALSRKGARREL